jgi:hypothetical protein
LVCERASKTNQNQWTNFRTPKATKQRVLSNVRFVFSILKKDWTLAVPECWIWNGSKCITIPPSIGSKSSIFIVEDMAAAQIRGYSKPTMKKAALPCSYFASGLFYCAIA